MRAIVRSKQGIDFRFAVYERCVAAGEYWVKAVVTRDGESVDYCYLNRGETLSDLAVRWLEGVA